MGGAIIRSEDTLKTLEPRFCGSADAVYIYAAALTSNTACVAVPIRASNSMYVSYSGSTSGLGSNASFFYSPDIFVGVPKQATTIPSGCQGWYQIGGLATVYMATGTSTAIGDGLVMITAGRVTAASDISAAYAGYPYEFAIAQEANAAAAASYCVANFLPTPHKQLLTT